MKSSTSCRRCRRWLEGEWSDASPEEKVELQRQMDQGFCDVCPNPPTWTWICREPGRREVEQGAITELEQLLEQRCPCFYFEADPDLTTDPAVQVCACGHADDEHDGRGECQATEGS